jgi:hypothetical protein
VGAQIRSRSLSPYAAGLGVGLVLLVGVARMPALRLRWPRRWHTIVDAGHEG